MFYLFSFTMKSKQEFMLTEVNRIDVSVVDF